LVSSIEGKASAVVPYIGEDRLRGIVKEEEESHYSKGMDKKLLSFWNKEQERLEQRRITRGERSRAREEAKKNIKF